MPRARRVAVWIARLVVLALAGVVALAVAVVLAARTAPGRAWIRELVLEQARRTIPGLDFARIRGNFVDQLAFDDVSVIDRAGRRAVAVRRVAVRFDLWPLLRRTVRLRELHIEAPVVLGRPDADGSSNLAHLARSEALPAPPAAPPTAPSRWRVQLERLRVDAGGADLRATDGASTLVSGLAIDAAGSWEAGATAVTVRKLELHVERDGRRYEVAVAGDARLGPAAIAARLGSLRVGGLLPADLVEVTGTLAGPPARIAVDAEVRAGHAGSARLGGTLALEDTAASGRALGAYDLELRSSPLVLGRLASGMPDGRLGLAVAARGSGIPLAPGSRAALTLDVPAGHVAGIAIHGAHVAATSDGDRWRISRSAVRASGATLAFDAHGAGSHLTGDLAVDVHGPLPGARGAGPHGARVPDVRGRGHLALHVTALLPRHLELTARVAARDISAGAFRLGAFDLDARVAATRTTLRGGLRLAGREMRLGANGPRLDALSLEAASEGGAMRLRGSASGPRLRAAVALHGPLAPRRARVTIDQLSLAVETRVYKQSLALQAPAVLDYRAGEGVALSRADLRGAGYLLTGAVSAEGRYSLAPDARGTVGALALILRRASLAGLDPVDADLRATVNQVRATATLEARAGRGSLRISAEVPVVVEPRGLPRLAPRGPVAVRLAARGLALQDLPAAAARLMRTGIESGTLDAAVAVDGDVGQPTASGDVEIAGVTFRNLRGGAWQRPGELRDLGLSARLEARPGELHLTATGKLRGAGVLRLDARADSDLRALLAAGAPLTNVPVRASVDIPAFDLAWLSEMGGALAGVGGRLTGHAEASGTLRDPTARADLRVANAVVDGVTFREVLVHGEVRAGAIELAVNMPQTGGGALYAEAHLPHGGAGPLRAHVGAKDVDVAFLRPFLPAVRELGGTLQATVDATGTAATPEVHGQVAFANGRIGVIGQPTFHDVTVAASLSPRHADLGKLSMRSGKGTLTAHGSAEMEGLRPQAVTLSAHADGFLISVAGTGARIDGDVAAEAALRAAVVSGKVRVPHAVVQLPNVSTSGGRNLQNVNPRPDVRFVDPAALAAAERQARQAAGPARTPTRLDLTAEADPVFVRSRDFDLEVESRLQISTAAGGAHPGGAAGTPTISGTVRIRRGNVNLAGQRFDVERGQLSFDGSPEPNPGLDIRLSHTFPDATVSIELRGTAKHPDLRLTSDPPIYEQAQILSLILTGQAGTGPGSGSPATTGAPGPNGLPFDPTSAVASLVLGKLADTLAPELGLDVLRVQNVEMKSAGGAPTGLTDTRVEVGKYVTERIYISYAHIFGAPDTSNANEARVEYRLTHRWLIQTIFGDAGAGSVDALWTYRH